MPEGPSIVILKDEARRLALAVGGLDVDELARRLPGALTVYDDLPSALRRAVADPASTWLAPGTPLGPSTAEVARRYAEVLA